MPSSTFSNGGTARVGTDGGDLGFFVLYAGYCFFVLVSIAGVRGGERLYAVGYLLNGGLLFDFGFWWGVFIAGL